MTYPIHGVRHTVAVIPAQAGIQSVIQFRVADKAIFMCCPTALGLGNYLDSGLRRNDGS